MRLMYWLLLSLAVNACGPDRDAAPRPRAGDFTLREQEQGFLLIRGTDTLAFERYQRNRNTIEGELVDLRRSAHLLYTAALGEDERIRRLEVAFYPEGQAAPQQRVVGEFRGDTLVARTWRGNGEPEEDRVVTPPGTLLQVRNSMAMLQLALQQFRTMDADTVSVPVLLVGGDAADGSLRNVAFHRISGDSVHIVVDQENQLRAEVDGRGRIGGAFNPHNDARVVRLR